MKTQLFLLFICAASLFEMQAQVFPESDAIWNIQAHSRAEHYGLSGDTIIDDKLYSKLYYLNDTTLIIDSEDEYIGGFRTEGKKVWFRPDLSYGHEHYGNHKDPHPEESILYDFSKNVGDTIWHNIAFPFSPWHMGNSIIASIIESIDTDEQGRTVYHIYCNIGRYDRWIEGIGSVGHGLFFFLQPISSTGPYFHLSCFKQEEEVKYIDNPGCKGCFCIPEGLQNNTDIPMEIVFENNNLFIKGEPAVFPCELQLFSPMGQLVLEKRLLSDRDAIPVNRLQGIYLYRVQQGEEIIKTGKIIFN